MSLETVAAAFFFEALGDEAAGISGVAFEERMLTITFERGWQVVVFAEADTDLLRYELVRPA